MRAILSACCGFTSAPVVVFVKAAQAAMSKATDHRQWTYMVTIVTCQRSRRASMPKCNAAPTSTWTPITGGTASAARTDQGFEPSLFVWATVMPSDRGPRHRRRRPQGARVRLRPAARLRRARRHLRARLRRARPPRHLGRHQPPRPRRQDPPRPRPLRPDRQPLRLVRRHPRQPRRAALADHRPRRGVLIGARPR